MKKRIFARLLCLAMVVMLTMVTAYADCGPKPTTRVQVHETGGRRVVVTLLAKQKQCGPYQAVEKGETPRSWSGEMNDETEKAWYAFRDYEDPDGFYFLGFAQAMDMNWTYYPPEVFKVAVYVPEEDVVLVSEDAFERYAFHSDFYLYLDTADYHQSGAVPMELKTDFDWMEEFWGFLGRAVLTILVELAVALLFGYRMAKQMKTIVVVNLVTQVGLNALLSMWYLLDGPLAAMVGLAVGEIVVLAVESFLYARRLPREGENHGRLKAVAYAFAANLASVFIGWQLMG